MIDGDALARGLALCAEGRFVEAEEELALAAASPGDEGAIAQANLAAALSGQGRHDEAIGVARGAVARAPDVEATHAHLASVALAADDCALALEAATRACALGGATVAHELRAIALAGLGRLDEAIAILRDAVERAPRVASAWRNLGCLLERAGDLDGAIDAYRRALALEPTGSPELLALCLARTGRRSQAAALLRKREGPAARHLLDAIIGARPPAPPPGYVADLFDGYAARFERHLVDRLVYRGHVAVHQLVGDQPAARAVDLGCGTGLVGALVRDQVAELTGVDLSAAMIEAARARGVYDLLARADVVDFLRADGPAFDLVTCADVLIYVGDPAPLLRAVAARLAPGGRFAFTVERCAQGWRLEPHARYSHASELIEALAARHRLAVARRDEIALRVEHGRTVPGLAYLLRAA